MILFSTDGETRLFTDETNTKVPELSSRQEEADTKVILHLNHALDKVEGQVVLRSLSADTDILVLAVVLIEKTKQERVVYDAGTSKYRKKNLLSSFSLQNDHVKALIGFHSFTGNDYVSALFKKSKLFCWKSMIKYPEFLAVFTKLGDKWEVDRDLVILRRLFVDCTDAEQQ